MTGLTVALVATSFGFGLRHGIDWDHIAAITDLTTSAADRARGFVLSSLYALGHAAVVFSLGTAIIAFGVTLPAGVDAWMGRVVGLTLVVLGVAVLVGLRRGGDGTLLRSRWMLVFSGVHAGVRRVRRSRVGRVVVVEHEHVHEHAGDDPHDHAHDLPPGPPPGFSHAPSVDLPHDAGGAVGPDVEAALALPVAGAGAGAGPGVRRGSSGSRARVRSRVHTHRHRHERLLPDEPFVSPGARGSFGVGMLHGVGVESPTQIAVFVAARHVDGGAGMVLLVSWIVGLIAGNSLIAAAAASGVLDPTRGRRVHSVVAAVVGVSSLALGVVYLVGLDAVLPAI